jgi:hypothetical protein
MVEYVSECFNNAVSDFCTCQDYMTDIKDDAYKRSTGLPQSSSDKYKNNEPIKF